MEYLEIKNDQSLAEAVDHANEVCLEPIRCNWDSISQHENLEANVNCRLDDLRFKLGFDHIELMNSVMEEKQSVSFIECTGSLKTLTMIFKFKISDTSINGKIRICSVLNPSIESCYKLLLSKMVVKFIVKLIIVDDNYQIDYTLHEFVDAKMSFVYKKNNDAIPVYKNIQDKNIKHSLVHYVVSLSTKHALKIIEETLRKTFGFIPVSVSLRGELMYALKLRKHTDLLVMAFNDLVDDIINSTNLLVGAKADIIQIPNISIVLDFLSDRKKSLQAKKISLERLNFLFRKRNVSISTENELVLLHVPVDFPHLSIKYKYFAVTYAIYERRISNVEEHYKTNGSYLVISLQRVGRKVDVNLLEFHIKNFELLDSNCDKYIEKSIRSWIINTLDFNSATVIENTFEKYFRMVMKNHTFDFDTILNKQDLLQNTNF